MKLDAVIDRFVVHINAGRRQPLPAEDVPPSLRLAEVEPGYFDWQVRACQFTPWVAEFQARLPKRLPRSFESLVTRYCFPPLEVGEVLLYANTTEGIWLDLRRAALADPGLVPTLLSRDLLPFARPATGSYDPVCFQATGSREYPVVRVDHESILLRGVARVTAQIAPSFLALLEAGAV